MPNLQTPDEVLAWLEFLVRSRGVADLPAQLRLAFMGDEPRTFVTGRLLFGAKKSEPRPPLDYPAARFREKLLDARSATAWLGNALRGRLVDQDGPVHAAFQNASTQRHVRGGSWYPHDWSVDVLTCCFDRLPERALHDPVVRVGAPPYPNLATALEGWVHDDPRRDAHTSFSHGGQLLVVVPDFRGRIQETHWNDNELSVTCEGALAECSAQIQVVFVGADVARAEFVPPTEADQRLPVLPGTSSIEVYLVAPDADLL